MVKCEICGKKLKDYDIFGEGGTILCNHCQEIPLISNILDNLEETYDGYHSPKEDYEYYNLMLDDTVAYLNGSLTKPEKDAKIEKALQELKHALEFLKSSTEMSIRFPVQAEMDLFWLKDYCDALIKYCDKNIGKK